MVFEHKILTRYAETGQDGIIHHSSYVIYLEEARLQFFKRIGFDINDLEKNGIYCPVIDLSIKYLKPLYSLEEITVQVSVANFTKVRFSLNYKILRENICTTTGLIHHCFLNKAFKPIPISYEFLEKLNGFVTTPLI